MLNCWSKFIRILRGCILCMINVPDYSISYRSYVIVNVGFVGGVLGVKWYQAWRTDAFVVPFLYIVLYIKWFKCKCSNENALWWAKKCFGRHWITLCCALDSTLPHIHSSVCIWSVNALTAPFKFKCVGYSYVILFITNERSAASSRLTPFRLSASQCKLRRKFSYIFIRPVMAGVWLRAQRHKVIESVERCVFIFLVPLSSHRGCVKSISLLWFATIHCLCVCILCLLEFKAVFIVVGQAFYSNSQRWNNQHAKNSKDKRKKTNNNKPSESNYKKAAKKLFCLPGKSKLLLL